MANILILNGSPRKNGKTASLIRAFTEGARSAGNDVNDMYLTGMHIAGCLGCEACKKNGGNCVQKDDMEQVNEAFLWADVIVFASPVFWGNVSGQLKVAVDRLFALFNKYGGDGAGDANAGDASAFGADVLQKKCALIMTSGTPMYEVSQAFYDVFPHYLGWENLGEILGEGKEEEARALGARIR